MKYLIPVLAVLSAAPLAAQGTMRDPSQLDMGLGTAKYPAIASSGNTATAIWLEDVTNNLWSNSSADGGATWGPAVRIDDDATGASKYCYDTNLASSGSSVYYAWRDQRGGGGVEDVFFTASHDGGATWSANVRIDDLNAPGTVDTDALKVAASGNNVYVLMRINRTGGEGLWLASSHDGGVTWNPTIAVDADLGDVDLEGISAEGADVHIAWCDNRNSSDDDLFYTMSHNGGLSFMGTEVQLDASGASNGDIDYSEIWVCSEGGLVAVSWMEDELPTSMTDEELHVVVSSDGGHNWGAETTLLTGADADGHFMSLGNDGTDSLIAVTWEDNRSGADEIYVAVSSDEGATWTENQLSTTGGSYPVVRCNSVHIGVTWAGDGFPENPYLATSLDGGLTFTAGDMAKGTQIGDADYVELAMNPDGNFHGIWLSDDSGSNVCWAGGMELAGPGHPTYTITGLVAGGNATLMVTGCANTSNVLFAYSLNGAGPTATPYGSVDMSMPITRLPVVPCDATGTASLLVAIPSGAAGLSVWLQAAEMQVSGAIVLTNALAETIL